MEKSVAVPRKVRSVWPPIVLGLMALGVLFWAKDYDEVPRLMPTLVAATTVVLCILDILSRFDTGLSHFLQTALGADFRNREMSHDPALKDEVIQVGWMISFVVSMVFIGLLPTVPLFIAAYMRFFGQRSWTASLLSALVVFGFVILVFEVFLGTTLYRGVLLDAKGFGAW